MLKLPIFKQYTHISPSSFLQWLGCNYKAYLIRQSGLPFIPQPSSLYAEIGTCFDAFVKEFIMKKRNMKIPALKLAYTLDRITHPEAIVEGRLAAVAYVKTPLIHQFLTAHEVFLEQELCTRHGMKDSESAVPILGRLDAIVDGKVKEWKLRGWGSQSSPYPGYADRYDCCYSTGTIMQRPAHNSTSNVVDFSFDWATQLLFYNWLLRDYTREYEIHEIVKKDDGIVIVQHKGSINEDFEKQISNLLHTIWENLTGGFYWSNVNAPDPSQAVCNKWGTLCEVAQYCQYHDEWLKGSKDKV